MKRIWLAGRYMRVDPDNRLVADSLEAEWNSKLRALTEAQQECERQREQAPKCIKRRAPRCNPRSGVTQTPRTANASG
jgi:hypothetical protein